MDYSALIRVDFRFLGLLIRVSWLRTHTIISHYYPCDLIFIPWFIISVERVRPRIINTSRSPKLRQRLDVTKDWLLSPYATLMPEAWCPRCWIRPDVSMSSLFFCSVGESHQTSCNSAHLTDDNTEDQTNGVACPKVHSYHVCDTGWEPSFSDHTGHALSSILFSNRSCTSYMRSTFVIIHSKPRMGKELDPYHNETR